MVLNEIIIRLKRQSQQQSWGFSIYGGRDFSTCLTIQKVTQDSLASKSNLRVGDVVIRIGQMDASRLTHNEARDAILSQANDLELTLSRVDTHQQQQQQQPLNVSIQPSIQQSIQQQQQQLTPNTTTATTTTRSQQFSPQTQQQSTVSPIKPIIFSPVPSTIPQQHQFKQQQQQQQQQQPSFQPRAIIPPVSQSSMSVLNAPRGASGTPMRVSSSGQIQALANTTSGKSFNRGLKGSALMKAANSTQDVPICFKCNAHIRGPFVSAIGKVWCPHHFKCDYPECGVNLLELGFVEENGLLYCEQDYARYFAPRCGKCKQPVTGNCVYALEKAFHPECFSCQHCKRPIGNDGFHLEDGQPYCLSDYDKLFTTKCAGCEFPIQTGDRFLEAINSVWHVECFCCNTCHRELDKGGFVVKANKPYCKKHAYSSK